MATAAKGQSPTSGEGERRRATLVFADLSGYTSMGEGLDPEDIEEATGEVLETARHVAEQYGGLVNQIVGDEIVMIFGMPRAYGNDAVRAVDAAMSLHERVDELGERMEAQLGRRLEMHSGVHTGAILFTPGVDPSGIYKITGDAVNVCARLRSQAESGEILIGPDTHAAVEAFFETEALPPLELKGKAKPMTAHRVQARRPHQSRFAVARERGLFDQVGRDAELARLAERVEAALGGEPQSVAFVGEAGVGKSRLLHEATNVAVGHGYRLLSGRCESYGNVPPYQVLLDVLRELFELEPNESLDESAGRVARTVTELLPGSTDATALFLHLLSLPLGGHQLAAKSGAALQEAFLDALCGLLAAIAHREQIALALEDWHWADDRSDLALQRILDALKDTKSLVMVTYRPEGRPAWDARIGAVLELGPLESGETAQLACAALGANALSAELAEFMYARTAGNPLFVEEFARSLSEQNLIVVDGGIAALATPSSAEALPTTVDSIVRDRIDRLPENDRSVLSMAAVIGPEFSTQLLETVIDEPGALIGQLGRLERSRLIRRSSGTGTYGFSHIVVHQVVYESMLRRRRRTLHAQVAHTIETGTDPERLAEHFESLARHYGAAEQLEEADRYSEKAGDKARRAYSLEQACEHYRNSVGYLGAMPRSESQQARLIDMTLKWGRASIYNPTSLQVEALHRCVDIAREAGKEEAVGEALYWLGWSQYTLGNHLEATACLERCVETAVSLGNLLLEAQANANLVYTQAAMRNLDEALAHIARARELEAKSDRTLFGFNYLAGYRGIICGDRGEFDEAFRHLDQALEGARKLGQLPVIGSVLTQLGIVQTQHAAWAEAIETAKELRSIGERVESRYLAATGMTLEGYAAFYAGADPESCVDLMSSAVATLESHGLRLSMSLNYGYLAEVLAILGRSERAAEIAGRALDPEHVGERMGDVVACRALAIAAVRRQEPDAGAAERHLATAEAAQERARLPREAALNRYWRAMLALDLGEHDRAREEAKGAAVALDSLGLEWYVRDLEARVGDG